MDLTITIHDDNKDVLQSLIIYQDGSDSEGAEQIANYIKQNFQIDNEE